MKSTLLWALGALNVLLLALFVSRISRDNAAFAQPRGRAGDYLMIPGEVPGGSSAIVFVIDTGSGTLAGISYDDARKRLDAMVPVDLSRLIESTPGAGGTTPRRP